MSRSVLLLVAAAVFACACNAPTAHSVAEGKLVWLTGAAHLKDRLDDIALSTTPRTLGDSCTTVDVFFDPVVNGPSFSAEGEAVELAPNREQLIANSKNLISKILAATPPLDRLASDYQTQVRKFAPLPSAASSVKARSEGDALRATFSSKEDTVVAIFGSPGALGDKAELSGWVHKYAPSVSVVFVSASDQSELDVKLCESVLPQAGKSKPQSSKASLVLPRVVVLDVGYFYEMPQPAQQSPQVSRGMAIAPPVVPANQQRSPPSEKKASWVTLAPCPPEQRRLRTGRCVADVVLPGQVDDSKDSCKAAIKRLEDSLGGNRHPEADARAIVMEKECSNTELASLQNLCENNFRDKVRNWLPNFQCEFEFKKR